MSLPLPQKPSYHAFLLRIWAEPPDPASRPAAWRFSLEDTHSGARRGFSSLDALLVYLADLTLPLPASSTEQT